MEIFKWFLGLVGGGAAAAIGAVAAFRIVGSRWLDHWLGSKLETHKASLGAHTEFLKHDLQREMLKAELATGKVHEVYSRLWEKIVRAHGAVSSLVGLGFGPSYEGLDIEDFTRLISETPISHGERTRLTELMQRDSREGLRELKRVLRNVELHKARAQVFKTKNYAALKSPFLSAAVREKTGAVIQAVWESWVEIHMNALPDNPIPKNPMPTLKVADSKLNDLEVQISVELHPGGKHVGIASSVIGIGATPEAPKLPEEKNRSGK